MAIIDEDGTVTTGPIVQINTFGGTPSELCWLAVSLDDRMAFATNFAYVTSFRIDGNMLSIARDLACPKVSGNGTFRTLNGAVSSGSSDNWLSPTASTSTRSTRTPRSWSATPSSRTAR